MAIILAAEMKHQEPAMVIHDGQTIIRVMPAPVMTEAQRAERRRQIAEAVARCWQDAGTDSPPRTD